MLSADAALNYIAIEGVAERRLMPDQICVVMAVSSGAPTVAECRSDNSKQIDAVLQKWADLGFERDKIVSDFIAISPRYAWRNGTRGEEQVLEQQKDGFQMLTNLHIAVADEQQAMNAVQAAIECGVTEIVAFEYSSSHLNEAKEEVRKAAIAVAKEKSELLLAVFDKKPPVINVQERTNVNFPQDLYVTYRNELDEQIEYSGRDKPRIKAYRPRNTFYYGLKVDADDRPEQIALRPEIVVVSSVRLYYQSPAQASRTAGANPGSQELAP